MRKPQRPFERSITISLAGLLLASCGATPDGAPGASTGAGATPAPDIAATRAADTLPDQIISKVPDGVKDVIGSATGFVGWYKTATDTVGTIEALLQVLGLLESPQDNTAAQFHTMQIEILASAAEDSARAREDRLADLIGDVIQAGEIVRLGGKLAPTDYLATHTAERVSEATMENAFSRVFDESATDGEWKSIIADRPDSSGGLVYDWRLGVPALMELIGLRLSIIASIDPTFRDDNVFAHELMPYRAALLNHLATMQEGVRCASMYWVIHDRNTVQGAEYKVACADIYTGSSALVVIPAPMPPPPCPIDARSGRTDPQCVAQQQAAQQAFYDANVPQALARLKQEVLNTMPLADIQNLANTLYTYSYALRDNALVWQNSNSGDISVWQINSGGLGPNGKVGTTGDWNWKIVGGGDFNRDGHGDILWQNAATGQCVVWYMNGISRSSWAYLGPPTPDWTIEGTGDFNGDGLADVLWRYFNASSPYDGAVAIWYTNPDGTISGASTGPVGRIYQIAGTGDFDGDGLTDIAWRATFDGSVVIWKNLVNVGGTLSASYAPISGPVDSSWSIVGTGDFNADGKSDILWLNQNRTVVIWFLDGFSILSTPSVLVPALPNTQVQGVGDMNGDGISEIVWRDQASGGVFLWKLNGSTGGFLPVLAFPSVVGPASTDWVVRAIMNQ
jgi:hypothetical protein